MLDLFDAFEMVSNNISCSIMFSLNYFVFCRYLDMEKRYKQEMDRRRGVTADFKVSKNCKISCRQIS